MNAGNGAPTREVVIAAGPVELQGLLAGPREPRGIVLFAHGSGSSRLSPRNTYVAGVLQGAGFATLLFDLLTASEEAIDAQTAELRFDIPLLTDRLVAATRWVGIRPALRDLSIGYFGASTGAAAALVAASRVDAVAAVVSRGGRPDLAGAALPHVRAATLLIVGGHDEQVLALNRAALAQLQTVARLEIVPGATHLFEERGALEAVARLAAEWFAGHLRGGPHGTAGSSRRKQRGSVGPVTARGAGSSIGQNVEIAARLDEVARVLEDQGANPYRVGAYRRAANTVRSCPRPMAEIVAAQGDVGLMELQDVGENLARAIHQLTTTGRLPMLERLRGEADPVALLVTVPGVGRRTALRLHEELGIHTLEDLEVAAHDGRLQQMGLGAKRIAGIRDALSGRLGRIGRRQSHAPELLPGIAEILDVDREYRGAAARGALPTIAPRRFNPGRESWLPVLHTSRADRHYSALYSNTARAHELGRTRDWVVLYFDGAGPERQCTVITAQRGPLQGRRVVPGRERECLEHYHRIDSLGRPAAGT